MHYGTDCVVRHDAPGHEPGGAISEHLADGEGAELPPITHERRSAWGDRRQEPDER